MYGLIRAYGRAMVGSWYRVEAHGEALPEQGAMILYANHNGGLVDGGPGAATVAAAVSSALNVIDCDA